MFPSAIAMAAMAPVNASPGSNGGTRSLRVSAAWKVDVDEDVDEDGDVDGDVGMLDIGSPLQRVRKIWSQFRDC